MAIDASIALGFNPGKLMSPMEAQSNAMTLRAQQQQVMLRQQEIQQGQNTLADQQKISSLYADRSKNIDPDTGLPTMDAMVKIGASPAIIQKMSATSLEMKSKKELTEYHKSETAQKNQKMRQDAIQQVREDSMAAYQEAAALGPQAAKQAGQKAFSEGIANLKTSGLFSKEDSEKMQTEFDPVRVSSRLLGYKEQMAMEEKKKADARADKAGDRADKREAELERHNRTSEERLAGIAARAAGTGGPEVSQPEKDLVVAAWIQNPASLRGMDKTVQRNVVKWAAEKGIKPEDVIAGRAQAKFDLSSAVTAGHRAGSMATVEAAMPDLLDNALEASKAVPREKFVPFNKLMQMSEESISDPDLLSLRIANQAVASEYQTVIARGGSNVTSLKEAMHLLQTATDQKSYARALKQVEKEVAINVKASNKVRTDIGKGSHQDAAPAKPAATTDADKAAVAWAKANPNDPRAKKILEHNRGL